MFGKKKAKDKEAPDKNTKDPSEDAKDAPKGKKGFPVKRVIIILLVLIAAGASGFAVYKLWFSAPADGAAVYKKIELPHVNLPEEMLRFSFDHYPDLYKTLIEFNKEVVLLETEIARIEGIAAQYPEQAKIAQKEKKVWEKTKDTLKKSFIKIEKPVKETYVLYRVNKEQGLLLVKEKAKELTEAAQSALTPVQEMTLKLKETEKAPDGLVRGTIFKLKKKFL